MRTENEMFELILRTAREDDRIRAVYMNGSRANPNAPRDKYQDYDIVYTVTETESFLKDENWMSNFGEIAIMQEPDYLDMLIDGNVDKFDFSQRYAWLTLFKDGNRIDLTIETKEVTEQHFLEDKMTVMLLDKDGILPELPASTDIDYRVKRPTAGQYFACCNEFWWCLNNVGKGIARDELPYVMEMFNHHVRDMLNKMTSWYIGLHNDFNVCTGKMGKYYKKYLPAELYASYAHTYSNANYENIWASIFEACGLFRRMAAEVAEGLGFTYVEADDENTMAYLNEIRADADRPDKESKAEKAAAFWNEFLQETELDASTTYIDSFYFDLTEQSANYLLELVLKGQKKATASSLTGYEITGERIPRPGDYSIVTDFAGNPRCVIKTKMITLLPFRDMTYDICKREGEDENLESWRRNHIHYFTEEGKETGFEFTEDMIVIFEDFEVVYRGTAQ